MTRPERIGRFRIERLLGRGGYATVWLAHDDDLDAPVAIKVLAENWSLDRDVSRRFVEEARVLRRLDDERVVEVHTIDRLDDGRPYFVMELADLGSLEDRIDIQRKAGTVMPLERAVRLSIDLASCLSVIHSQGVVHRDVKPSNILFKSVRGSQAAGEPNPPGERMLLADFGIARRIDSTGATITAGTPLYMAPEQADPETAAAVDARSDVYSAAVIMYEMLVGTAPYKTPPTRASRPVGPPSARAKRPDIPAWLDDAITRGLAMEPADRWPNVEEWASALRRPDSPSIAGAVSRDLHAAGSLAELADAMLDQAATVPLRRALEDARSGLAAPLRLAVSRGLAPLRPDLADQVVHDLEARIGADLVTADSSSMKGPGADGACVIFEPRGIADVGKEIGRLERTGMVGPLQVVAIHLVGSSAADQLTAAPDGLARRVAGWIDLSETSEGNERDRLLSLIQSEIVARSGTFRTRRAIDALEQAAHHALRGADAALAEEILDGLEGITLEAHELKELDALEDVRSGRAPLPEDLRQDVERVLATGPIWRKLGLQTEATQHDLQVQSRNGAAKWHVFVSDGRAHYLSRRVAEILAGSYQRLDSQISEGHL